MEMERNNEARVRADFIHITRAVLYNTQLSLQAMSQLAPSVRPSDWGFERNRDQPPALPFRGGSVSPVSSCPISTLFRNFTSLMRRRMDLPVLLSFGLWLDANQKVKIGIMSKPFSPLRETLMDLAPPVTVFSSPSLKRPPLFVSSTEAARFLCNPARSSECPHARPRRPFFPSLRRF